ncbi:hypothetical protein V2J09_019725 [Rumex salicifolius]
MAFSISTFSSTAATTRAHLSTPPAMKRAPLIRSMVPANQTEVIKSLEGWASEHMLPMLKPVEECWQPQDYLPDSSKPLDEFTEEVRALRDRTAELSDDYFVVLVGDMITEDAVPTYHSLLTNTHGFQPESGADSGPWATWTRCWTAEENRHGDLLRSYLYLSGRVDMVMVERTVQYLIGSGSRATAISHGNTARLAKQRGDDVLARICGTITADEKRHEKAYSAAVGKLLEVDPTGAMLAISDMMRKSIVMPSHLMYDGRDPRIFHHYASVAQRMGVYTTSDYVDILEHLVGLWRLEELEDLTAEGREAQEFVCGLPHRIRSVQERAEERAKKHKPCEVNFSWIFNNKVLPSISTRRRATSLHRPTCAVSRKQPPSAIHRTPESQGEVLKSLEGWASEHMLPFLKPVEESWQPQDYLPDSSLPSDEFAEEVRALQERTAELPDDYLVVLVGDMITEDALPTYHSLVSTTHGFVTDSNAGPWATWNRRWTAEENRHGDLLRSYLYLSGRVDMAMVERTVQYLIGSGMEVGLNRSPYTGLVYTSFQERATFVSHGNTARLAKHHGDTTLARVCGAIAADEKRHERAYCAAIGKILEVDPTGAILAVADLLKKGVKMPAHLMYDGRDPLVFDHFSDVAQRIGVYTAWDYADILEHLVGIWRLESVEDLTAEGREAQEFVCGLPHRIRRLQEKAEERAKKLKPRAVKFSWIFNKELTI